MTPNGAQIGSKWTFTLAARHKETDVLSSWIPETDVQNGGFVVVRTTNNVALYGLELFGSSNGKILASVAGGGRSVQGGGPFGGVVNAIAIDPTNAGILYAATDVGVFKSTNAGLTWTSASLGLPPTQIASAIAIDPTNTEVIYAASNGSVYKTLDGGQSWSAMNTGITNPTIKALAINPKNPAVIYAAANGVAFSSSEIINGGLFKSTNGGESWIMSNAGLTNPQIDALAIDPRNPDTIYAGSFGSLSLGSSSRGVSGLFKSIDGGTSWAATNGPSPHTIVIDPTNAATIYVGASTIYKSTDGGVTWTSGGSGFTAGDGVYSIAISPQNSAVIYAGTRGGGVLKSTDGGQSWRQLNGFFEDHRSSGGCGRTGLTRDSSAVNECSIHQGTERG